jgi:hypothetical protein
MTLAFAKTGVYYADSRVLCRVRRRYVPRFRPENVRVSGHSRLHWFQLHIIQVSSEFPRYFP